MTTATLHPDWTESPLVRFAIERAGKAAEAIDVLGTLSDMLNELEELAPGVPFADVVAAWNPESASRGRAALRHGLADRGMTEEQVEDLLGPDRRWGASSYEAHPHYQDILADRFAGDTMITIAQRYGVTKSFVNRLLDDYLLRTGNPRVPQSRDVENDPEFHLVKALVEDHPEVKDPEKMAVLAKARDIKMGYRRIKRVMEAVR